MYLFINLLIYLFAYISPYLEVLFVVVVERDEVISTGHLHLNKVQVIQTNLAQTDPGLCSAEDQQSPEAL